MGLLTQGIQVPGRARRPRLRLHGSVAGVASRAPRTRLRTDPSIILWGGAKDPEGEEERPESVRKERGETEREEELGERRNSRERREEGEERSWKRGGAGESGKRGREEQEPG